MATDTDRALSLIKEKVELLTGERANGNRRAVLISELDALLKLINDKTITLGNKIESEKQELSEEFWKTLEEEAKKIGVEIDKAVEKAREDFEKAIIEAKSAIETTRQASQSARLDARNAFQDAQTSIIRLREQSDAAFTELAEIVETILEVRSDVDGNSAAITIEAGARATADSALSGQVTTITAQVGANSAAIVEQEVARVDLESALSATNSTLSASFNNNKALIEQEAITRATADDAASVLTSTLQATVGSNSAAITQQEVARVNLENALAATGATLSASFNNNKAQIDQESVTRASADSALSGQVTTITAQVGSNSAAITQQEVARTTLESALSSTNSTLSAGFNNNKALIEQEAITRATADDATSVLTGSLQSAVGSNSAAILNEQVARATNVSALSAQFTSLQATVNNNKALFDDEVITRASEDSALSGRVTTVEASTTNTTGNGVLARLITEELTRATADGAVATAITAATAGMNRGRVFQQTTQPSSFGRQVGDIWYDTDDNYRPYYWTGSFWADNSAGTYKIGAISAIEQSMTAMNDAVQWGVQGTIAGQPAGQIALTGWKNPTTGEVRSRLYIQSQVLIEGNLLVTGSITGDRISTSNGVNTDNVVNAAITDSYYNTGTWMAEIDIVAKKAGDRFLIIACYDGGATSAGNVLGYGSGIPGNLRIMINPYQSGPVIGTVPIRGYMYFKGVQCNMVWNGTFFNGVPVFVNVCADQYNYMTACTTFMAQYPATYAGNHTVRVETDSPALLNQGVRNFVLRLSK